MALLVLCTLPNYAEKTEEEEEEDNNIARDVERDIEERLFKKSPAVSTKQAKQHAEASQLLGSLTSHWGTSSCMHLLTHGAIVPPACGCGLTRSRPRDTAVRTRRHLRSSQIGGTATADFLGEEHQSSAHKEGYFGEMGKRSRKTRKRVLQNLPGRGFPHKVEDAHQPIFLAHAKETAALALATGTSLTAFRPG